MTIGNTQKITIELTPEEFAVLTKALAFASGSASGEGDQRSLEHFVALWQNLRCQWLGDK